MQLGAMAKANTPQTHAEELSARKLSAHAAALAADVTQAELPP